MKILIQIQSSFIRTPRPAGLCASVLLALCVCASLKRSVCDLRCCELDYDADDLASERVAVL